MNPAQPRLRAAALIVEGESLLMVRHQKDGRHYWLLPGGGVDQGETVADALKRELREEIGVEIEPGFPVQLNEAVAPDHSRHVVQIVLQARILSGTPRVTGLDPRVDTVEFQPFSKLPGLEMYLADGARLAALLQNPPLATIPSLGNLWR